MRSGAYFEEVDAVKAEPLTLVVGKEDKPGTASATVPNPVLHHAKLPSVRFELQAFAPPPQNLSQRAPAARKLAYLIFGSRRCQQVIPILRHPLSGHNPSRPQVPLFITLEGIDGSGKTTLAKRLREELVRRGAKVFLTKEPTSSWLGEAVRRSVEEDQDPQIQTLLFLADRLLHVGEIREHLDADETVVCDRYHDSTLAYQGVALEGRVPNPLEWIKRISSPMLLKPDLTLLLVVEPHEGLARISGIRRRTPFEDSEFLKKVQDMYLRLAKDPRFVRLDSSRPPEVLAREALSLILARLEQ